MNNYWLKQSKDKPLYSDLLWSKPINKSHAGKLSIVGGSASGFATSVNIYNEVLKAGIGQVKAVLPESTKKIVGNISPDIVFAPTNKSGGFASNALSELIELGNWSDSIILAGEISNNSETTVMIESFISKQTDPMIIAGDSLDSMQSFYKLLLERENTILICSFNQLQKLITHSDSVHPLLSSIQLTNFVDFLHDFTRGKNTAIVTEHSGNIIIASNGKVSTTKSDEIDLIKTASHCAVWIAQNPNKIFEALNCAVI